MRLLAIALLGMQRALLGVITPQIRGVCVDVDEKEKVLIMTFYHEGNLSLEDREDLEVAMTEASCCLAADYKEDGRIIRKDSPETLITFGKWAYLRKETPLRID